MRLTRQPDPRSGAERVRTRRKRGHLARCVALKCVPHTLGCCLSPAGWSTHSAHHSPEAKVPEVESGRFSDHHVLNSAHARLLRSETVSPIPLDQRPEFVLIIGINTEPQRDFLGIGLCRDEFQQLRPPTFAGGRPSCNSNPVQNPSILRSHVDIWAQERQYSDFSAVIFDVVAVLHRCLQVPAPMSLVSNVWQDFLGWLALTACTSWFQHLRVSIPRSPATPLVRSDGCRVPTSYA